MTGTPLVPVITRVGKADLVNDGASGFNGDISHIGFGLGRASSGGYAGYVPTNDATALANEVARVPLLQGTRLGQDGFRVMARLPAGVAPDGAALRELGVYLSTGVLLCLWSDPVLPVAFASRLADYDVSFDLILSQLPVDKVQISVLEPDIPDTMGILCEQLALSASLATAALAEERREFNRSRGNL